MMKKSYIPKMVLLIQFILLIGCQSSGTLTKNEDLQPPAVPVVELETPGPILSASSTIIFKFHAAVQSFFFCALDGHHAQPCQSPYKIENLGDGKHLFSVYAKSSAGSLGGSAKWGWVVETASPVVQIDTKTFLHEGASFKFQASKEVNFFCAVDGGVSQPCASPYLAASLPKGKHTFSVYAVDGAGNQSLTQNVVWTGDEG